jgi:enterochelin esterase-like enzyme
VTEIGLICLLFWSGASAPVSSRIERFRAEAAKDPTAEQSFWQEVERKGAPLVEPAAEPGKSLVTFLFRGAPDTRRVVVLGDGTPGAPADNQLAVIPGTSVWHRTYLHRSDARFLYALSPNDDLRPMESVPPAEITKRMATLMADPFNRGRATDRTLPMSELSLPDAPRQPYLGPPAPMPVEKRQFKDLTLHIYRPAGANGPLPLLVLFDGSDYAYKMAAPATLENLLRAGRIRPVMLAMVDNAPGKRNSELTCNEEFATLLATALVPWLRANYAVSDEPAAVGGMSYGGLAASFAALRYPKVFGAVLSQSGSYWWRPRGATSWEWLAGQYRTAAPAGIRFYQEVGLMEVGTPGGRSSMLDSNRRFRDLLRSLGAAITYSEFNGDHSALNWRGSFADGLVALFANPL